MRITRLEWSVWAFGLALVIVGSIILLQGV